MKLLFFVVIATPSADETNHQRVKRQEDDPEGPDVGSIEELCHDRPADEYFRLTTEGDCRDVVR